MNKTEFLYFLQSPLHEQCAIFSQFSEQDLEHFRELLLKNIEIFAQSSLAQLTHPLWHAMEPMVLPYIESTIDQLEKSHRYYSRDAIDVLKNTPTFIPLYLRCLNQRDLWNLRTFQNDIEAHFYDVFHATRGTVPNRYQKAADLFEKHLYAMDNMEHYRSFFHTLSTQELRSVHQHVSQNTIGAVVYHAWETEEVFEPAAEMILGIPETTYWNETLVDSEPSVMILSSLGGYVVDRLKAFAQNRFYPSPMPYIHNGHRLAVICHFLERWARFPEHTADLQLLQHFAGTPLQLEAFQQWYENEKLFSTLPKNYQDIRALPLVSLPLDAWGIELPKEHPHLSQQHLQHPGEINIAF